MIHSYFIFQLSFIVLGKGYSTKTAYQIALKTFCYFYASIKILKNLVSMSLLISFNSMV